MALHSLPSKKIAIVDIPEVDFFKSTFIYNFFTTDERVNDDGTAPEYILKRPTESFDANYVGKINHVTPRYVKFNWKPKFKGKHNYIAERTSIRNNFKKIHNEESFATDEFTAISFQDNDVDEKAAFYIEEAIEHIEKSRPEAERESPLDIAKTLNDSTSREISGEFLSDVFVNLRKMGVRFLDSTTKKEIIENSLEDIKSIKTNVRLNNKFIKSMLSSVEQDRTGFFSDDAAALIEKAASIQSKAISNSSSTVIKSGDYDLEILDFLSYKKIDTANFDPITQIIGYIIEKDEILPNGNIVKKDPIIIESPLVSTTIDLKVKYGTTYVYRIKSVAYLEFQTDDENSNELLAVSFLACSRPSQSVVIQTTEEIAPPWPSDFNIGWDYFNRAARLMWNFPVNPQRDIKKFQVFRRKTIYEPFELIQMYDFDDSIIRSPYFETPEHHLIELLSSPKSYYLDREFNKESKYIYAVCSIDAHGFSSNYSTQYEISFDKFANKITKKIISTGGAPKQYPNMYLKQDTFVDVIKDSGHKRMKIYFNPEYLEVEDKNKNNLNLLKTDAKKGKYIFQIINVDLQTQKSIQINLKDKRTSQKKNR